MSTLTPALLDLMEHEKVIEQGLQTFVDVGLALLAIKDGRKYQAAGYDSFESYCKGRWGWSQTHGYRMIEAAKVAETVSPIGETAPTNEWQVRPLTKLESADEQREAWTIAISASPGPPIAEVVAQAVAEVEERRRPQLIPKSVAGPGIPPHPATYPAAVLAAIVTMLEQNDVRPPIVIVDPFAGVGTIHKLADAGWGTTIGVELEPEWAAADPRTIAGDSRRLVELIGDGQCDAIITSPAYGNRLADSYNAYDPESRRTYSIDLGHQLSDGNGAGLPFTGDPTSEYCKLHGEVWAACARVLRPGGIFILNCKDFVRSGEVMSVTAWHVHELIRLGFRVVDLASLPIAGLNLGGLPQTGRFSELLVMFDRPQP